MDIFTEAFTYNGDGTFTITEDALRRVFTKIHLEAAVWCSPRMRNDEYYQALSKYEERRVGEVEDKAERDKLLDEIDSIGINALADYTVDKLKSETYTPPMYPTWHP